MFLICFYPRMNKPNIHNNIGNSSFQNVRNHPFSSTGFYFKSKILKVVIKWKNNMLFNLWTHFLKVYIVEVMAFFHA